MQRRVVAIQPPSDRLPENSDTSKPQRLRAVDPSRLDWIVPGDTIRSEVRGWLGVPDNVIGLDRGTTHWVYVGNGVASEKGVRAIQMARIETRERAENPAQFAENTKNLGGAEGDLATNVTDWLYPPKPLRRTRLGAVQRPPAAVSSPPELNSEDDERVGIAERVEPSAPSIFDVISNSINIMQSRIGRSRLAGDPPELLVTPRLEDFALLDFDRADEAIVTGRRAVAHALAAR